MKHLLDANVFITAKNSYYAFDIVPVFWEWLEAEAGNGSLASTDIAVAANLECILVTLETPAPQSKRSIKIPDVCQYLEVSYENTFKMMRNLNAKFTSTVTIST